MAATNVFPVTPDRAVALEPNLQDTITIAAGVASLKKGTPLDLDTDGTYASTTATAPAAVLLQDVEVTADATATAKAVIWGRVDEDALVGVEVTLALKAAAKANGIFITKLAD